MGVLVCSAPYLFALPTQISSPPHYPVPPTSCCHYQFPLLCPCVDVYFCGQGFIYTGGTAYVCVWFSSYQSLPLLFSLPPSPASSFDIFPVLLFPPVNILFLLSSFFSLPCTFVSSPQLWIVIAACFRLLLFIVTHCLFIPHPPFLELFPFFTWLPSCDFYACSVAPSSNILPSLFIVALPLFSFTFFPFCSLWKYSLICQSLVPHSSCSPSQTRLLIIGFPFLSMLVFIPTWSLVSSSCSSTTLFSLFFLVFFSYTLMSSVLCFTSGLFSCFYTSCLQFVCLFSLVPCTLVKACLITTQHVFTHSMQNDWA